MARQPFTPADSEYTRKLAFANQLGYSNLSEAFASLGPAEFHKQYKDSQTSKRKKS